MSETERTTQRTPLTREQFEEVIAADETILELSLPDLDPLLYSYNQAKQLLLHFDLPITKGMKKKRMMADLLAHRKETELARATASTSASATMNNIQENDNAEEEAQLQITAQQVEASNAEEDLVKPTVDIEGTKAEHGAEIGKRTTW